MHFCRAKIAIGEDRDNVFCAGNFDPISWPEVMVLQALHGEGSISDVEPFVEVDITSREERGRLARKYGESVVATVFGGKQGPAEMNAPRVGKMPDGEAWMDPFTRQQLITGEDPSFRPLEQRSSSTDEAEDAIDTQPAKQAKRR